MLEGSPISTWDKKVKGLNDEAKKKSRNVSTIRLFSISKEGEQMQKKVSITSGAWGRRGGENPLYRRRSTTHDKGGGRRGPLEGFSPRDTKEEAFT